MTCGASAQTFLQIAATIQALTLINEHGICGSPAVGLALTADPFIRVFYGSRWLDAIAVMQVLSVYMLVQSLSKNCGDVYKAMGRPGVLNKLAVLKLAVTVPLLVIAVPEGIVAVAFAQLAAAAILTIVRLLLAARIVGVSSVDVFTPFIPSVRAAAAMVAVCLPLIHVLDSVHPWVELVVITVAGAAVYGGTLWVFDREHIRATASVFRRRGATQGERPAKVTSG